jgi:hypothetical protein
LNRNTQKYKIFKLDLSSKLNQAPTLDIPRQKWITMSRKQWHLNNLPLPLRVSIKKQSPCNSSATSPLMFLMRMFKFKLPLPLHINIQLTINLRSSYLLRNMRQVDTGPSLEKNLSHSLLNNTRLINLGTLLKKLDKLKNQKNNI